MTNNHEDTTDHPLTTKDEIVVHTRKRRPWLGWLIFLLVVAAIFILARRHKSQQEASETTPPPQIPNIKVAEAHRGSIGYYVEALGTVTPVATVNLYSQVNGVAVAVHFTEGQIVHRGDPLLDIDPRPYEAQLQESQGQLEHDQAVLQQAKMDLARYEQASTPGALARQTFEDQQSTVEQYKGTVKNDVGQVQYAKVQLSYCHLTSPINGRVGLRLVDPGNTIFSGSASPIVVITQLQPITVVFNVAEDNLSQVHDQILHRSGLPVDAFDRSQQVKLATGKLLTLDNQVDTSTGTVRFRGQFDNKELNLFPNQFVNARLLVKTLTDAVLVPSAAIQRNGTQAFVYVVNGDTVKTQNVTELTTDGDVSAVDGLNSGEIVPVTGFDKLQQGAKVKVQSQQAFGQANIAHQEPQERAGRTQ
ncbi:efflux RND transporter periplasmic adaptor subunit [Granulicella sp. S156]|uniref:efflux RND transporter periplasmic adaptor subunit n=1 Tax=Granulicella sp. S156 TaxID=1747224 RepID=UPI00131ADDB9|nr:efflux RND transporter periplasmic adaptor subunit [Granulicella sp. S156]